MRIRKNTGIQTLISIAVLGLFAWLGIASYGGSSQQSRHLGNGVYETAKFHGNGKTEIITGKQDEYGNYHGEVIVTIEKNGEFFQKEEVTMLNGVRHGESYTLYKGKWYKRCYDQGEIVDCEKSGQIYLENETAFDIFNAKYPWMAFKMLALGLDSNYIKSYVDTIETMVYSEEFTEDEFDLVYEDVLNELDGTRFDSISEIHAEVYLFYGHDLLKNTELRLATIDRYRQRENSTFEMISSRYPHYLQTLSEFNVTSSDFEVFCVTYDSLLISYGPLDYEEPYFLDSLNSRMFRALEYMSSEEKSAWFGLKEISAELLTGQNLKHIALNIENPLGLKNAFFNSNPQAVSLVVLELMFADFIEADLIRKSVKKAWKMNNGFILMPTVTTSFSEVVSESSVSIAGNVLDDGGGEITERGIVWAEYHNPATDDQVVQSGTGSGQFSEIIPGLEEEKIYYARAFAKNSSGTSYGNNVMFNTSIPTSVLSKQMPAELKVFPNPASQNITFQFEVDSPQDWELKVINLKGQTIYTSSPVTRQNNTVVFNLSGIKNGVYTCILKNHENQVSQKFLVIR